MKMLVISVIVVITIAYVTFDVWHIFIAKKQIDVSFLDFMFFVIGGGFLNFIPDIKIRIIIFVVAVIWSLIICYGIEQNNQKQNNKQNES